MINSSALKNSCILLAGSIHESTDNKEIDKAHTFVEALVTEVLKFGGSFIAYFAEEVFNDDQKPLLFDWTIARKIDQIISGNSNEVYLKIITSPEKLQRKNSTDNMKFLYDMVRRGLAEFIPLDEDLLTGGIIIDKQIEYATAMVALSGGKGVLIRADKMVSNGKPVLPLDLKLGSNRNDGDGAIKLFSEFRKEPLKYMPNSGEKVVGQLPLLSLQIPMLEFSEIAELIVKIFYEEERSRCELLPPDVLILTALPVELAAAKEAFGIKEDQQASPTEIGIHIWKKSLSLNSGSMVSCAVACFADAGNMNASAITSHLISLLKPKRIIMLGIAAGMREKHALGEVVFCERIISYEKAAVVDGGCVRHRPEIETLSFRIQQEISTYTSKKSTLENRLKRIYQSMNIVFPESSEAGEVVSEFIPKKATVASGDLLVRDGYKFQYWRQKLHDKISVAEMEGAGVCSACRISITPLLMIRGISDHGDSIKDDCFHELAAKASAAVSLDYITNGIINN